MSKVRISAGKRPLIETGDEAERVAKSYGPKVERLTATSGDTIRIMSSGQPSHCPAALNASPNAIASARLSASTRR